MRYAVCASLALLLAACSERGGETYYESINYTANDTNGVSTTVVENPYGIAHLYATPAYLQASVPDPPAGGDTFTYSHVIRLEMARDAIRPHFERARDNCLSDPSLSCTLVSSTVGIGADTQYRESYARLTLLIPHDKIEALRGSLLQPLDGAGVAELRSRSTQAGNVTKQAGDLERKLTQLTQYRDRLNELSQRRDVRVDELIRLASELATTESNIEQATAQKQGIGDRIARDQVTITFIERLGMIDVLRPALFAWRSGVQTFGESSGAAVTFVIAIIPWLPIIALGLFILTRVWGRIRKGRMKGAAS